MESGATIKTSPARYIQLSLRRLMARVGGKEAFDEGRRDLEELAGVFVTTKAVERISECVRGANAIIALRCCDMSGRWEQYWEHRAA